MTSDFNIHAYKSIIALNGDIPSGLDLPSHIPIIAADGAADQLKSMGMAPNVIIGDLDSIQFPSGMSQMIHIQNQDQCDFEKALLYCQNHDLSPSLIIGVGGGELDHTLNNVMLLSRYHCDFLTDELFGKVLTAPQSLSICSTGKISIIPMPTATISTSGFAWDLAQKTLIFPQDISLSNRLKHPSGKIMLIKGRGIVFIHFDSLH